MEERDINQITNQEISETVSVAVPKKKRKGLMLVGIILGCIAIIVTVTSLKIRNDMLKPALDLVERIEEIDLESVDRTSFKQITLIKQDYKKLSDFQKKNVTNYDKFEQAEMKYQADEDEVQKKIKKNFNVVYMPIAEDIKVNSQKIVERDDGYYYIVSLTNESNDTKIDFKVGITTYDETWNISNHQYSDVVDFLAGKTRNFEFRLDETKVDAATVSLCEEKIAGERTMLSIESEEIIQIKRK